MAADTQRILNGGETDTESVNEVTDVPSGFKDWMTLNTDRIAAAKGRGTLPYFLKDNASQISSKYEEERNKIIAIKFAKEKYLSYGDEWEKVYFNENNGGFNVYHKKYQFTNTGGGGDAEKKVGKLLAINEGKQVEFLPENGKSKKLPDLRFDDSSWDVKYINEANVNTIRAYIKDARKADNAIFYYTNDKYQDLRSAINREVGRFKSQNKEEELPNIYYMTKSGFLKIAWKK